MEFFFADQHLPFTVALGIVLALSVLEIGFLFIFGFAISKLIHVDSHIDVGHDYHPPHIEKDLGGVISKLLGWLRLGNVPVLVSMLLLMMFFGISGYILQFLAHSFIGSYLRTSVASGGAFLLGVIELRLFGKAFYRFIPKDETEVVDRRSFLREVATITTGVARKGHAAEAKLKDVYGYTHYVMVEPQGDDVIHAGSKVVLTELRGDTFECVWVPYP